MDVTVNYTLERFSIVILGLLARFLTVALLFRLNLPRKCSPVCFPR